MATTANPTTETKKTSRTGTPQPELHPLGMSLSELKEASSHEQERQTILRDFVTNQLQRDTDYGMIEFKGRLTKPTLFKPGMEKIFSLFNIVSKLEKDEETLSMLTTRDVVAYKCILYRNGSFVSEGRGACTVGEKGRVNDAIKIAEKRARMDACLNLGFSEFFTQDLDDLDRDRVVTHEYPGETGGSDADTPQDMTILVEAKEEKTARSGNPYAELTTDQGKAIAFRNSMGMLTPGKRYQVSGHWEQRGERRLLIITSPAAQIVEVEANEQAV